ncbi:MAG: hypothetical protein H6810_09600 [Phycisphaeraceae bacterium]|nr:MAG: hypothetical protein H6810_09600 [Phycisphaeraceae bacterium]
MIDRRVHLVLRAFTLIEVLVVVTLLIVVLGIAVPAFRGMLDASERTLSENSLRVGVQVARDVAMRGEGDAAVVFFRDLDGRTRMVPAIKVGTIEDGAVNYAITGPPSPGDPTNEREVFAPIALASPIRLPRGWAVSGYADPNTIDQCLRNCALSGNHFQDFEGWYDSTAYGDDGSSAGDEARLDGNWLLPETAYYEVFMQAPGAQPPDDYTSAVSAVDSQRDPRQTFMVRFKSGTGELMRGSRPAIVLDPRPTSLGRGVLPQELRWARANRIEDAREWCERVINTEDLDENEAVDGLDAYYRAITLGSFSNDTVLAGPVSRLALYRDEDLVKGLGASGLNKETNSLYKPIDADGRIEFDLPGLFANNALIATPGDVRIAIDRWMQGDTNFIAANGFQNSDMDGDGNIYGDGGDSPDTPMAKLFVVQPGTGELTEVKR